MTKTIYISMVAAFLAAFTFGGSFVGPVTSPTMLSPVFAEHSYDKMDASQLYLTVSRGKVLEDEELEFLWKDCFLYKNKFACKALAIVENSNEQLHARIIQILAKKVTIESKDLVIALSRLFADGTYKTPTSISLTIAELGSVSKEDLARFCDGEAQAQKVNQLLKKKFKRSLGGEVEVDRTVLHYYRSKFDHSVTSEFPAIDSICYELGVDNSTNLYLIWYLTDLKTIQELDQYRQTQAPMEQPHVVSPFWNSAAFNVLHGPWEHAVRPTSEKAKEYLETISRVRREYLNGAVYELMGHQKNTSGHGEEEE